METLPVVTAKTADPSASPAPHDQFADFRKQFPAALLSTNIDGVYASPATPGTAAPGVGAQGVSAKSAGYRWLATDLIVPQMEAQKGKTHRLRGARKLADGSFTSDNWSGGTLQGKWASASGTWVVPTVAKPSEPQGQEGGWNSSSWVGLDGAYGSDDVLQAGVQQRVDGNGNAAYVAWYEWYCGIQKQTLGDTSPLSPALASLNGRLFIAWKGDGNDNLNVMYSADNGQTFGNKYTSPETSPQAPGLCVHNGNLYITWKGDGNDHLNLAVVDMAGDNITGFSGKTTLGDTSPLCPALASLNGRLFIAWKGDGNDHLNVMYSSDNGQTFGNKYTSGETSPQAPGLCVHNGSLYITWKGDGNDNLNVAIVSLAGNSITGFSNKTTLGDTSPQTPSLASLNGRLYISWKGDGNDNLNIMYSSDNGRTFGNKYTSPETSPKYPSITDHEGNLFIAWKGDGNDHLNVSLVGLNGSAITGFTTPAYLYQTNITNFAVNPGDTVMCKVEYLSGNTAGSLSFANQNSGKHFSVVLVPPPGASFSGNCGEWIMEAPDGGYPNAALPKFTPVKFTGSSCEDAANQVGNPQNGDTWNITANGKTLTAVTLASEAVTVAFEG